MTWEAEQEHWRKVPFDHLGYADPADQAHGDLDLLARRFEEARYGCWRNWGNLWREHMGLDKLHGRVLDYGCGSGIESLQYARAGNDVSPADINQDSVLFASRLLAHFGYPVKDSHVILEDGTLLPPSGGTFDLVAMNGVLHHIRQPENAAREIHRVLRPGGQWRVMVYTDVSWRAATGTEPPENVDGHQQQEVYRTFHDGPAYYCDWYSRERLEQRFGGWFDVSEWHYIGLGDEGWGVPFGRYGIGVMVKK